jgi:hypothetical protein
MPKVNDRDCPGRYTDYSGGDWITRCDSCGHILKTKHTTPLGSCWCKQKKLEDGTWECYYDSATKAIFRDYDEAYERAEKQSLERSTSE